MVAPKMLSAVAQSNGTQVLVTFDQAMLQNATFFNVANWAVTPGHAVSVVAGPTSATARLTITPEMLAGASLNVAAVNIQNVLAEVIDPSFDDVNFTGVGVRPEVASVVATGDTTIRVTFTEGMTDNAALNASDNYVLSPVSGGAVPLVIAQVQPEVATNPTYVDLTVNEMTDGATYRLAMSGTLLDAVGNLLDTGAPANTVDFTGSGTLPDVTTAVVLAGNIIRINFSEGMRRDSKLGNTANYLFTPVTAGAAQLFFSEVLVPNLAAPSFVEIEVTEMTDGATYDVTVNSGAGGPTDLGFNPISASDTASFTGEGEAPTIAQVIAVSKNRADVVFSEPMLNNVDINDPSKYTWDNGLVTEDVLEVTAQGVVKLATNDQVPGVLYTLTATP